MFDHPSPFASVSQLRSRIRSWKAFGEKAALVPVVGPAHDGHLALMQEAQKDGFRVAACLIGEGGPGLARDIEADSSLLDLGQADVVHVSVPGWAEARGSRTRLAIPGVSDTLSAREAPARLEALVLALTRMMVQTQAEALFLSDADWQLCVALSQVTGDLDLPAAVRIVPALREADGLAVSAEAGALSAADRRTAARLVPALRDAVREIRAGVPPDAACRTARAVLGCAGFDAVDFVELRHAGTLAPVADPRLDGPARLFASVRLAGLRLAESLPA